jgi:hypothetical protein
MYCTSVFINILVLSLIKKFPSHFSYVISTVNKHQCGAQRTKSRNICFHDADLRAVHCLQLLLQTTQSLSVPAQKCMCHTWGKTSIFNYKIHSSSFQGSKSTVSFKITS